MMQSMPSFIVEIHVSKEQGRLSVDREIGVLAQGSRTLEVHFGYMPLVFQDYWKMRKRHVSGIEQLAGKK